MKTAAEWAEHEVTPYNDSLQEYVEFIRAIQSDAFAAGAEAQRESDASLFRTNKVVASLILSEPLVTLPKGEG